MQRIGFKLFIPLEDKFLTKDWDSAGHISYSWDNFYFIENNR
jgi:hypothetical protein